MRRRAAPPRASLIVDPAELGIASRRLPAALVTGLAIGLAGGAVYLLVREAAPLGAALTAEMLDLSAGASARLGRLADTLPLGYAFGVGMVAAVNPCGFALLPAYLGVTLGPGAPGGGPGGAARQLGRAVGVSLLVTLGFAILFGVAGLAVQVAYATVARALPWLGVAIGAALIVAGARALAGRRVAAPSTFLVAQLAPHTRAPGPRGPLAYGLAYGLASLGCALPLFLSVVGSALTAGGPLAALRQYLLYALGMGSVVAALTLLSTCARLAIVRRARHFGRLLAPLSAILLIVAGAYVLHYWLTIGGVLATLTAPR